MLQEIGEISYRDGYLSLRHKKVRMVIRGWPAPVAKKQKDLGVWKPCYPQLKLIKSLDEYRSDAGASRKGGSEMHQDARVTYQRFKALKSFREAIPDTLLPLLEPFNTFQWDLLHALFFLGQPMLDILRSNPVLAYMVSVHGTFREWLKDEAARPQALDLIHKKQRDIVDFMGLPGSKSTVNGFRKIAIEDICQEIHPLLQAVFNNNEKATKMAAHCTRLHVGVLTLLSNRILLAAATPRLLKEVEQSDREREYPFTARKLEEYLQIQQTIGLFVPHIEFHSYQQLETALHEIQERLPEFMQPQKPIVEPIIMLTPPTLGTGDIEPLKNYEDFCREGREQHNCVRTYFKKAYFGRMFVYRVLQPERATLSIIRNIHGHWIINELLATCNQPVRRETWQAVENWLRPCG